MVKYFGKFLREMTWVEYLAFFLGLFCTWALWVSWTGVTFRYDEPQYLEAGRGIFENGFFSAYPHADLRTYGYPLFLAAVSAIESFFGKDYFPPRALLTILQSLVYFCAAFFIRGRMIRLLGRKTGSAIFIFLCLNVFNLIYLCFALTETLSNVSLFLAVTIIGELIFSNSVTSARKKLGLLGLLCGLSLMIRPANLFLVASVVAILLVFVRAKKIKPQGLYLFALSFLLLLLPQVVNNYRNYGRATPLTTYGLFSVQMQGAALFLKYATSIAPDSAPGIQYANPMHPGGNIRTSRFLFSSPLVIPFLTGIKFFALIDQDLMFPYNRSLTPWHRWPGTLVSLTLVGFGLAAVFQVLRSLKKRGILIRPEQWSDRETLFFSLCMVCLFSYVLYSQSAVESRFGLPLLSFLGMFAIIAWMDESVRFRMNRIGVIFLIVWIAGGAVVSEWLQCQSPQITAYKKGNASH